MNDLFGKISSYNIFNKLLPGVVFVVLAEDFTIFRFVQEDIIRGVFFYYFLGLVISRLGSLVVEPFFKLVHFVSFAPYWDFVTASSEDEKLTVLCEVINMYRTFCAMFIVLAFLKVCEQLSYHFSWVQEWKVEFVAFVMFLIFCFSYKKQCQYIKKRIESNLKKGGDDDGRFL